MTADRCSLEAMLDPDEEVGRLTRRRHRLGHVQSENVEVEPDAEVRLERRQRAIG